MIRFLALLCVLIGSNVIFPSVVEATPPRHQYTDPGQNNSAPGDDDEPHVEEVSPSHEGPESPTERAHLDEVDTRSLMAKERLALTAERIASVWRRHMNRILP